MYKGVLACNWIYMYSVRQVMLSRLICKLRNTS